MLKNAIVGGICFLIADDAEQGSVKQQMAAGMAGFCLLNTIMGVLNGESD